MPNFLQELQFLFKNYLCNVLAELCLLLHWLLWTNIYHAVESACHYLKNMIKLVVKKFSSFFVFNSFLSFCIMK